jgi:hypothetical protein
MAVGYCHGKLQKVQKGAPDELKRGESKNERWRGVDKKMARFLSLISRERLGPPPAVTLNLMCWPVPELPHKAGKINFCPPHSHQLLRPHLHFLSLLPRTQSPQILYLARPSLTHALPSSLCDCPLPKYYPQSHLPFVAQRSSHIWTLNDFPARYSATSIHASWGVIDTLWKERS